MSHEPENPFRDDYGHVVREGDPVGLPPLDPLRHEPPEPRRAPDALQVFGRRVYIAAPLEARDTARDCAREISARGFRVVSTWHCTNATRGAEAAAPDWEIARALAANAHEIARADVVLLLHASGGRETLVELGIALANGVPVVAWDVVRLASYRRPGVEWIDPESCSELERPNTIAAELAAVG